MDAPSGPDSLCHRVQAIVTRIAGPNRTPAVVGPATPLASGGFWLDSTALLEVILACETEFGVVFDSDEDFTADSLRTIQSLASLVRGKR